MMCFLSVSITIPPINQMRLTTYNSCCFWLFGISLVAISSNLIQAQEQTPVRQLGQSTATNPYELALDGQVQRRNREAAPDAISISAAGGEDTWWSGMEDIAQKSMDQSAWAFKFGMTAGWEYDTNFRMSSRGSEDETSVYSVSPYGTLSYGQPGYGLDFQLRYAPEFRWFSEDTINDVINHAVSASLGLNGSHSRVALTASYAKNEGGSVEVGGLVTSDVFNVKLAGSYDISPKTSIGGDIGYNITEYDTFNSFDKLSAGSYIDYAITPKVRLGLGLNYEHLEQDTSLSQDAFSLGLRFNWAMTEKVGITGLLSGEYREIEGGESIATPTFSVGAYYKPTQKITTQLSLYRRATPSIGLSNTIFYATGAALSSSYMVTDRIRIGMSAGYEVSEYEATDTGGVIDREDTYFFVRPTITYTFNSHLSANLFYQYSTNDSSTGPGSSFDRNQIGLYLSLAF